MVQEIYSAVVERCQAAGIAEPAITTTLNIDAGTSNEVTWYTNALGVTNWVTNVHLLTESITVTNEISSFTWGTNTCHTWLRAEFVQSLDEKIQELIPYFLATNQAGADGTFSNWFGLTNQAGAYPSELPVESKAGLFSRIGVGFTTNLTSNAWGFVDGGFARWTRHPRSAPLEQVLGEAQYRTGAWTYVHIKSLERRMYSYDARPILRYYPSGTNALTPISCTITGPAIKLSDQSTFTTGEFVNITATNTACTVRWFYATDIAFTSAPPNTGDVFALMWTNAVPVYQYAADEELGWLSAENLDERRQVLDALRWTPGVPVWALVSGNPTNDTWTGPGDNEVTWAAATNEADTGWGTYGYSNATVQVGALGYRKPGGNYDADLWAVRRKIYFPVAVTSIAHVAQIYVYARPPNVVSGINTAQVFAALGEPFLDQQWILHQSWPESHSNHHKGITIGTTNKPATWCTMPGGLGLDTSYGWAIHHKAAVLKWDGTNGFRYQ